MSRKIAPRSRRGSLTYNAYYDRDEIRYLGHNAGMMHHAPTTRKFRQVFGKNMNHRHSIRLKDYDYTQAGAYFVTICTHDRICRFGNIVDGVMHLNNVGNVVVEEWQQTAILRPYVDLDAFVVMPNHFHGIIVITDDPAFRRGMIHHARMDHTLTDRAPTDHTPADDASVHDVATDHT